MRFRESQIMSDDYKIYVDGGQPAILNNGAGALTDYPSLQEAVLAWRGLPPEQKVRATIKVVRGPVYAWPWFLDLRA